MCGLALCCLAAAPPIRSARDVAYVNDGTWAHKLDLYVPSTAAKPPLIVFVHGGAFIDGNRSSYRRIGEALAGEGYATAVVSYRLFPQTDAYGSTDDVAAAVAWLQQNANAQQIDARTLFLIGHSAGAQIVSLLGTNTAMLTAHGVDLARICGVLPDAGAYDLRDISGEPDWMQREDEKIFGATTDQRARISAQLFVGPNARPMLVACGTDDDPDACGRAIRFVHALNAAGGSGIVIREVGADHMGMLRGLVDTNDPLNKMMREFISQHC